MRPIKKALEDHELITLRVIGEWWELDLTGSDQKDSVEALADRLTQIDMQQELTYLPQEEIAALKDLVAKSGRLPVAVFSRKHGDVRMMGPGRLEREEPWFDPTSVAEALWYRGFLYRGFDEGVDGLLEFYFLPDELLQQFPKAKEPVSFAEAVETVEAIEVVKKEATAVSIPPSTIIRPPQQPPSQPKPQAKPQPQPQPQRELAPIQAPTQIETAVVDAVDDLTTLLALALNNNLQIEDSKMLDSWLLNPDPERRDLLLTLAREMNMIKKAKQGWRPTKTAVVWLKKSRDGQLHALAEAWSSSPWNDLCHTPALNCEGDGWQNDPLTARAALLDNLPRNTDWYTITDLVAHIKRTTPDFQRPDGNYDTWYIRDIASGGYLKGINAWDQVEGRLLRFLIEGALTWLGMVEIASTPDTAYRLTPRALTWLQDETPRADPVEAPIIVHPDGSVQVPANANRYKRFQTARICEPQPVVPGKPFLYRVTTGALAAAKAKGIQPSRILEFLESVNENPLPKSVQRAVTRYAEQGVEARLQNVIILRVSDSAILETLRNNTKTRDYIGESLAENAAVINRQSWPQFRAAAAQLGLLLDVEIDIA